jgi:hypothetical protein
MACFSTGKNAAVFSARVKHAYGHDPRRVIDEGDEVGLALPLFLDRNRGAMHDVAHPELACALELEMPMVLVGRGLLLHEAVAREQAVYGRNRELDFVS